MAQTARWHNALIANKLLSVVVLIAQLKTVLGQIVQFKTALQIIQMEQTKILHQIVHVLITVPSIALLPNVMAPTARWHNALIASKLLSVVVQIVQLKTVLGQIAQFKTALQIAQMEQIKMLYQIVHAQIIAQLTVLLQNVMVPTARWHSVLIVNRLLSVVALTALLETALVQTAQFKTAQSTAQMEQIKLMEQAVNALITVLLIVLHQNVMVPTARWHNVLIANKFLSVVVQIALLKTALVQTAQFKTAQSTAQMEQIKLMEQAVNALITVLLIALLQNVMVPTARWHNVLIVNRLLSVVALIALLETVLVQTAQFKIAQQTVQIKQMEQAVNALITVLLIALLQNVMVPTALWHNVLIVNRLLSVVALIALLETALVQTAQFKIAQQMEQTKQTEPILHAQATALLIVLQLNAMAPIAQWHNALIANKLLSAVVQIVQLRTVLAQIVLL